MEFIRIVEQQATALQSRERRRQRVEHGQWHRQTIGGIVTILPIPGAQIAGPLISLGASLLGGLFGDSGPKIAPQPALVYGAGQFRPTGTGSFSYTGDSLGSGSPMQSNAEAIATDLTKAFRSAGLTVDPSALIGGNIASGTDHVLNGTQWQDRAYTQSGLILPCGGYETLGIQNLDVLEVVVEKKRSGDGIDASSAIDGSRAAVQEDLVVAVPAVQRVRTLACSKGVLAAAAIRRVGVSRA